MNCWKTINITKQYGSQRIFILSIITMLFAFILLYIPSSYLFVSSSFNDNYFLVFCAFLFATYPLHKLCHYVPVISLRDKLKITTRLKFGFYPIIHIRVTEPISKHLFLTALLMPFVVINSILLAGCFLLPDYAHYFTILLAYHIGLCVSDMICAKDILFAPKHAYIEENEDGFEILVCRN
ncbi:DUF3267 domain-containing protein [Cytobacillus sp. FJAT-54145]|uniref:DUF3267 domain-containing protein n=1 Tax=Cytobacillus spartinae TaxID=3299023 RepID=A0ABW6K7P3_9BACI